jgi:hypothetical protein
MLVRITEYVHVAPDEIAYVETLPEKDCIYVCMKNNVLHRVGRDYGKSVYDTQTRLLAEINAARSKPQAEA